jgi:hypothetical protein
MSTLSTSISSAAPPHVAREAPVGPQDAGRFLKMHTKTVLRKARSGTLPAHPVGSIRKRWHFYLSELDDWLRSQRNTIGHQRRTLEAAALARARTAE